MKNASKLVSSLALLLALAGVGCSGGGSGSGSKPPPGGPVAVSGVSLDQATLTIPVGGTAPLSAAVSPADAADPRVAWGSSAPSVVRVDQQGLVTGVAEGTAVISVTTSDGGFTASSAVTVTPNGPSTVAVTGVTVSPATVILSVGGTATLGATLSPANATDKGLTWSSSNAAAVTVSTAGVVTAAGVGTATVTATTADGGFTASSAVTVNDVPLAVTGFSPTSGTVGTAVTILGTGFSTTADANVVKFNGAAALVTAATATSISTTVPEGASTGPVSVAVGARSATSSASFAIQDTTPSSIYDLTGFAAGVTGGGNIPETDPAYAKVATPQQFLDALYSWYKNKAYGAYAAPVKVIEITADLNLGYNEIGDSVRNSESGLSLIYAHADPKLHPVLLQTGVSKVDVKYKNGGLTLFSRNGATIRHVTLNIKGTSNIIVRNLKFDEMWEWDEKTKGNYDSNDWDFIDIGNGSDAHDVWIDHCTFTKAYDGIADIKGASYNITISWSKYAGDDGATNPNSFVRQQLAWLEANKASTAFYRFLRDNAHFTVDEIAAIIQGHDKTHLIGATTSTDNLAFTVTLHHDWFLNPWDRLPRLRGGQVHVYNIYVDDTLGLQAKRLRDARIAAMSSADQTTFNKNYSFNPFLNGTISTEGGAVLVEKSVYLDCLTPLRNNQTDPSDPTYTGKVKALDTIYRFHDADGSTVERRGDSTDPSVFPPAYGNGTGVMGPGQATVIPFSWNTDPWNVSGLPYTYRMDDPAGLGSIVTAGSGAGVVGWEYRNWLKTSY